MIMSCIISFILGACTGVVIIAFCNATSDDNYKDER